jgi:hypothetical protein
MTLHRMRENTADPFGCVINGGFSGIWMILVLGFSSWLLLGSCDSARRQPIHNGTNQPILSASPNPVPAGNLDQPVAATQISWNTGNKTIGDLYVKVNRTPEVFLARGPSGTLKIDWIQFDSTYEFRLYAKKRSRLLAKLDVTRDN